MSNSFQCPRCGANLPAAELADGWCETCGKQLPLAVSARATELQRQATTSRAAGQGNTAAPDSQLWEALGARGTGCFMLVLGLLFSYLSIYSPLMAAARHERSVSLTVKGVFLVPACLVLGLILAVSGERGAAVLGMPWRLTRVGWCCVIVLAFAGFLLLKLLEAAIASHGYAF